MKKILLFILAFLFVIIAILLFNTFRLSSKQMKVTPADKISLDEKIIVSRLQEAIRYKTISAQDSDSSKILALISFQEFLKSKFPLVYQNLELQKAGYSLIFKWKGKNNSLKPVLLMSHQDVVPVDDTTGWEHPAFEGFADEKFIYGRGTLDDKCGVLGILEASEMLISKGFQPERTVYFSFGHDEEIGGEQGAAKVAEWFHSQNIELESVLDEGGTIVNNIVPGVKAPVALIGIAEKGYATIELSVESEGGHSSMPPPQTSAGILSAAVEKLESNQFKPVFKGATADMFSYLAPEMDFGSRLAFANIWLLEKVVIGKMKAKNSSYAAIHTTTAVTILRSGTKENVLPAKATAIVNFRILPGETSADVMGHVKKVINDERVKLRFTGHLNEPSPVSDIQSPDFVTLHKTIREVFPDALVAPYLVLASTDSKHFSSVSNNVYRFLPIMLGPDDLKRIHGTNERISRENYTDIVRFYTRYISNTSSAVN